MQWMVVVQNHTIGQSTKNNHGVLSQEWEICITHPPLGAETIMEKGMERPVRASKGQEGLEQNQPSGHNRTTALKSSQQLWVPPQEQASQHSSMNRKGTHDLPSTTEALWAVCLLGEENQFSLRMWLLVHQPCSSRRPHMEKYMDSTIWSQ